ncbi:MAG: ABC transporter substrate-binding protein [Acidimicrobiales bacterium]|jgi:branched-chain amino acid transport system substrate-binding protein
MNDIPGGTMIRRECVPSRAQAKPAAAVGVCLVLVAGLLTACSSTDSTASSSSGSSPAPIPASAFADHTGVTADSVTVGNVTTQLAGLFTGAVVGTEAYAAYVNSQGGVNGRKIVVQSADDQFSGATNKQETESVVQQDFASVGGLSLEDSFSEPIIAADPGFPDVTASLDPATEKLPNNFSPLPAGQGWPTGPLLYFKQMFPSKVLHTGTIIANLPSTELTWSNEKAAMQHLGYRVLEDPALPATTTDFTEQVVTMKAAGVQILFLEQEPQNYASAIFRDLDEQDFHPVVVLGAPSYNPQLVANSGGAQAVDGAYLEQVASLYLGGDADQIPAITTFTTWVHKVSPGFTPDFFTLTGWLCAELFVDALRNAGTDPSRGSLLQALRKITAFQSGNLVPVSNPSGKVPVTCYLLGQVTGGNFERLDDPPVSGPTHGFRCDGTYHTAG